MVREHPGSIPEGFGRHRVNAGRYVAAVGAAIVLSFVIDVLINAVILREAFVASAQFWLPPDVLNARVPLGLAALAGNMAFLGLAFVLMGRVGMRAGLVYGACLAAGAVAAVIGLLSLVPWPPMMVASMALQQAANSLALGASLGWLYRPAARR